jgi:hypothetical protein
MGMWHLTEDELLSGEKVIKEKNANAVIKLKDYGLRSLSYRNWGGTEEISGRLHLTNYRLVFASHSLNRVTGKFSILLPTIQQVKDTTLLLIDKRIEIQTQAQIFEFRVWGIPEFIALITSARDRIDAKEKEALVAKITHEYPKLGESFKVSQAMNTALAGIVSAQHALEKLTRGENPLREILSSKSPFTSSSTLNILEFLGERVQEFEETRKNEE